MATTRKRRDVDSRLPDLTTAAFEKWAGQPVISRKKPSYPIIPALREYLSSSNREIDLPLTYNRLLRFHEAAPLYDEEYRDTFWVTVVYEPAQRKRLNEHLLQVYGLLKSVGADVDQDHLFVDRIDFCEFGNSQPFRIRIVNEQNGNQDFFYIKKADASRVYGLELEYLLSPNRVHFLTCGDTLIEEHVVGIPGDVFIRDWLHSGRLKKIRIAKEFVKFNERCFVRLLGDMRSYNFVVEMTPDIEEIQVRFRAMDFDQECYIGRKNFYLTQYFVENRDLTLFCIRELTHESYLQYQLEERAQIYRRMRIARIRLNRFLDVMEQDTISTPESVVQLRRELAEHYERPTFERCASMGAIVRESLEALRETVEPLDLGGKEKKPTRPDYTPI
ncbi:MAG: hypothetical protein R3F07_09215 [Opitutaceae bacterium]